MHKTLPLLLLLAACGTYDMSPGGTGLGSSASEALVEPLPADEELTEEQPTCNLQEPVVLYASPDDSNSMSSPMQALPQALAGTAPNGPIRTYEFFNYATWDYAPADPGQLAVDLQLVEGDEPGTFAMQVGISSEWIEPHERTPMVLTFSVDRSGSMDGPSLNHMKESLRVIAGQLRPGDIVSVIGWGEDQEVLLAGHPAIGPNDPFFLATIDELDADGGTDLAAGLRTAYRITEDLWTPGRIHRVVLMSDGGANIGHTDERFIGKKAGANDEDGIYMIGVGTGVAGGYNDLLMNHVTDVGRGAAVFIPSKAAAKEVFGDRFLETMSTTARDVQIRYDLPPGFEIVRFSGEELSADPDEVQPQHMAPNDSVVLYQHLSSCSDTDLDAPISVTVSYLDGVTLEPREVTRTATIGDLLQGNHDQLLKGAAVYAFAETLKRRQSQALDDIPSTARHAIYDALEVFPNDDDLLEMEQALDALGL